ncbi:MAG: hypothetical protein IJ729_06760 [Alloprevotella sp.]|nr:hypothetical protein [Alloprevotella sp.]
MRRFIRTFAALSAAALLLTGCDDGRIYDEVRYDTQGAVARLDARLTGVQGWPDGYYVAIAGFEATDNYAVISKVISAPAAADGTLTVQMAGIPGSVETVELCVLNRLRQRVATFVAEPMAGVRDTLRIDAGTVDVSPVSAIQTALLNPSCVACHGATGSKAAGLDLTAGNFYAAVVGQPSRKVEGSYLVAPGDAAGSVFSQVLNTDISATWRQNHADMLNKERTANLLALVDAWIEAGAEP